MNIVFIKDKLNSIDSVLPILFECYKKYNQKSLVVVSDKMAYTGIQENIVIRDAINYFGSVVYLGKGFHNKVIRRMFVILKIINFIIRGINGAKFIHFGHLDLFPYKILGHLFKKNVYLVTATPFEHYFEDTCLNGIPSEAGRKNIYNMAKPIGKNFIYFNKNSLIGLEKYKDKLKIYDINRVKMRKDWVSFVFNKLPEYMYNQHPTVEKNDKVITFMLGGFFAHIVPGVVDS